MNFFFISKKSATVTLVTAFSLCILLCGCGAKEVLISDSQEVSSAEETEAESSFQTDSDSDELSDVYVYICGAVRAPGVYAFPTGSRVCDAVTAAAGFEDSAKTDYYNQAELLYDGEKIYIPTEEEAATLTSDTGSTGAQSDPGISSDGKININYATADQLVTISGIGETRAQSIIDYRETNGLFSSIEEITNVSGIGDSTYDKIKDYITVN